MRRARELMCSLTFGNVTLDVTSLESSDGRFGSGMYRSGATRFVVTEPLPVSPACVSRR